ncbi:hypothetical protein B4U80_14113 [Leptotrombidium deliense]|uniref:MD-2-related lipid-recognition domain-containing protein n=1 Tax=Leptotrombidium deliense TaxID=299467 RepID=A0A443S2I2_9ACAR|nr:hypothetical protein B4U80_14113 [Leptotrombidium deliense]
MRSLILISFFCCSSISEKVPITYCRDDKIQKIISVEILPSRSIRKNSDVTVIVKFISGYTASGGLLKVTASVGPISSVLLEKNIGALVPGQEYTISHTERIPSNVPSVNNAVVTARAITKENNVAFCAFTTVTVTNRRVTIKGKKKHKRPLHIYNGTFPNKTE